MVGGGPGAFIGAVHRKAAALDGEIELVGGAFSSSPDRSRQQGGELGLSEDRVYDSYQQMAEREASRPDGDRIDFVSIVTPNDSHFAIAKTFIQSGFHVVCDKPMTTTIEDAEALCRLVSESGCVFALTHNYTGYPMVKQARELVRTGKLGEIRKVVVEYPQGWLATLVEEQGLKQAEWRTDPQRAGVSSAVGDIGSHAENLVHYITGLEIESLIADTTTFVEGRQLEDDANVLLHYRGGARGILYASQISVGEENNLRVRIYGTQAALEWRQENPNYLSVRYADRPEEVYKRGNPYLAGIAQHNSRLPSGHPEAFINAFANIYVNAARTMKAAIEGAEPGPFDTDYPTVQDGARGVHFIHKVIESGRARAWIDANYHPPG
jgi:predicted dehydrogenase